MSGDLLALGAMAALVVVSAARGSRGLVRRSSFSRGDVVFKGKPGTRLRNLEEVALHGWYIVRTWSPGDGVTRYRFFALLNLARRGEDPNTYGYFSNDGQHTALGYGKAKDFAESLSLMGSAGIVRSGRSSLPDCSVGISSRAEHFEMLKRISDGVPGACWSSKGQIVSDSVTMAEGLARRDYSQVFGKTFLVPMIYTVDGDQSCPDQGCLVKVVETPVSDVLRWQRTGTADFLDPIWNVQMVTPSKKELGLTTAEGTWILGRTYVVRSQ